MGSTKNRISSLKSVLSFAFLQKIRSFVSSNFKSFQKMKFKIFLAVLLLLLIGAGYYMTAGYYSKGERAGTISKLSERGYIFKTYEGLLNEGGYSGETGTLTPRYFDFSCKIDTTITKLQKALKTGERVTIKYSEKFFQFPWNGDTKYFVDDVEFIVHPVQATPVQTFPQQAVPATAPITKADSTL